MKNEYESMPEQNKKFYKIMMELKHESDRGLIIVAATAADCLLRDFITTRIRSHSSQSVVDVPKLFSKRIVIAYQLKYISKEFEAVLHNLREFRNIAAHSLLNTHYDLMDKRNAKYIESIVNPYCHLRNFQTIVYFDRSKGSLERKLCSAAIVLILTQLEKLNSMRETDVVAAEWKKSKLTKDKFIASFKDGETN